MTKKVIDFHLSHSYQAYWPINFNLHKPLRVALPPFGFAYSPLLLCLRESTHVEKCWMWVNSCWTFLRGTSKTKREKSNSLNVFARG